MARAPAAGAHPCAEPGHGVHERAVQPVVQHVLQRAAGKGCGGVLAADAGICCSGIHRHRAGGVQVLHHPAAGFALARLDDAALHGQVAGQLPLLPPGADAAKRCGQCARQPRPAHPGRHRTFHGQRAGHEHGPAQRHGHAGVVHRHPLDGFRQHRRAAGRTGGDRAGLHGVGGPCLLRRGQRICPFHRPPADPPELLAGMARGRFPLQPGAAARIQRGRGL